MPMGEPYKCYLEHSQHCFEREGGAEFARQSLSGLLQGLLIDSLLGRDLDRWLEIYELQRDAPPPDHSTLVVPQVYLLRAGAGWLLNQPVEAIVNAGWDAVDTAWSDADYDHARRIVSSAALGLAHARGNQEEIAHWCRTRQHYAPTDAMTDVELQLGSRAMTTPDIIALVGKRNVSLFSESVANAIAALSVQANSLGQPLANLLSEGCRRIDDDYWQAGVDEAARADFEDLTWSLSEDSLNAYLFISGRGGYLHNPAPLLQPLLEIAQTLEQMLIGNMPDSLKDDLSNGDLRNALADPDVPLQVTLCISDSIHNELDIDDDTDLAPFQQRLATSVQWMQQRHADFAGEVELTCI
jgi:hypothetical protein